MKYFILFLFFSTQSSFAGYKKPQLLARLSDLNPWNAPSNTWCFFTEPTIVGDEVYLPCFDYEGNFMARWGKKFEALTYAQEGHHFSQVVEAQGKAFWYENDEFEVKRSFVVDRSLRETKLGGLTSGRGASSHFHPLSHGAWFFQAKGEAPELMQWKNGEVSKFFDPKASFIFTPSVGPEGEIAFKTREKNNDENSPDKIWFYAKGAWKVILEDKDANASSPWISFRHQLSVDKGRVVTIAKDKEGEKLILIGPSGTSVIARQGRDVKSFDFFTVKIRGETIAFRGVDLFGRKAIYVHDKEGLRKLITQGDIVMTDIGPGRVHYKNADSIFYGAPAIGEKGEIVQQATLTDPDFPDTFLGIGIIKFVTEKN